MENTTEVKESIDVAEPTLPIVKKEANPRRHGLKKQKGRIIIRNLNFTTNEEELKSVFSKFGSIKDIKIPLSKLNNKPQGFAFIEFDSKKEAKKAIKEINGKEIKKRVVAVDYSLPREEYEKNKTQGNTEAEEIKDTKDPDEEPEMKDIVSDQEEMDEVKVHAKQEQKQRANKFDEKTTLFVRNIHFDTTDQDLYEFFKKFGPLNYAKLCMNHETGSHKGTGFVKFKKPEDAEKVLKVSGDIETKIQSTRVPKNKKKEGDIVTTDDVELKGRRLIVMRAMKRDDLSTKKKEDEVKQEEYKDKRNMHLKKEGLTNIDDFENQEISPADMKRREKFLEDKENSLKSNPNLFVSKTRLTIRNLPKKSFDEKELKTLFINVINEKIASTTDKAEKAILKKRKFVQQVKVLKSKDQMDREGNPSLRGIGFIEFTEHEMALYCLRVLNNQTVKGRPLIIDFSSEDVRAVNKLKNRLEKYKERKAEEDQKKKEEGKGEKKAEGKSGKKAETPQLKEETKTEKKPQVSIEEISDPEVLKQMMESTISRGKKQRIKKRMVKLGFIKEAPAAQKQPEVAITRPAPEKKMLKKRKQTTDDHIEKQIFNDVKKKKKEKRNIDNLREDNFEDFVSSYKKKILANLEKENLNNS